MPSKKQWQRVRGDDLVEGYESGTLEEILPERSVIYLWKRNLRCHNNESDTAERLTRWLAKQFRIPNGRVVESQISHMIHVPVLELRPGELPPQRQRLFTKYFRRPSNRRYLTNYLEGVALHLPALYVGESGNLLRRTREHLHGESQFGSTVAKDPDLSWIDLDLFYWDLSEADEDENQLRKAIELVTTAVTIGGFTRRPG